MACSLVSNWTNYKKPVLDIIMVNNGTVNRPDRSEVDDLSGFDRFLEAYGYEVYDNAVYVDSSLCFTGDVKDYDTAQVLSVMLASGGKDIFFATEEVFGAYAEDGAVADLTGLLPEDLMIKYQDKLVYTRLHGTGDEYPCGIRLSGNQWMVENNYYLYNECVVGILSLNDNLQISVDFLEFLLGFEERG